MQPILLFPGIVSDAGILGGKPVIEGTRIAVALVLGQLAGGVSIDEVIREYHLSAEKIYAALSYAAHIIAK